MARVLILDGSIFRDMYRPDEHWGPLLDGAPFESAHLPSGATVPPLERFTHLIVTGSEASIVEPAPWYDVEAAAVREAASRGLAILGSCFGHQMLALALSGPAHVRRSPTPEVGWVAVRRTAPDPLLDDLGNPFHVFASHFDEVLDPPAPWRVLARSDRCAVQAMRLGDRPIWGLQAHPEIDPANARVLVEGFLARRPDLADHLRPALAQPPRDDGAAQEIVRRFLASGR
jgi:GMP synthase-like glutamine amidotransferase